MEFDGFTPVDPVRPAAGYIGGKRVLAKSLVQRISDIPHETYAEVFVGMGGVFFRRKSAPKAEVINDFSGDVATFFRIIQRHYTAFVDMIRYQVTSRREFERLKATDPATLTDLERSARFLYLQRTAFGGKVAGRNFGVSVAEPGAFDVTKIVPLLEAIHERLAGVVIEQQSYQDFIPRYDRAGTLFYLDPPYWGSEGDYGKDLFGRADFETLAQILRGVKERFLLSLNDCPGVRETFAGFAIESVRVTYTISRSNAQSAGEVIISNSPIRSSKSP